MGQPIPMKRGSPDDFQTPKRALLPLVNYIPLDWTIWECASGCGNLVEGFTELGYNVIGTDIIRGTDFLTTELDCDIIVTNPPYSLKDEFLERVYSLGKPFAFLLPITSFEGKKRQALFKKYGVQVIFFNKRISFETPTGKSGKNSSSWFMTAWFTYGLNLKNDFIFVEY